MSIDPKKTVTKELLAENLKERLGLSNMLCEEIVSEIFDEITEQVYANSQITIKNFGKFFINKKDARPGLNVKTGEYAEVTARTVMRFTPSRSFKAKL